MPLGDRAYNILPLLFSDERLAQGDIAFVAHSYGGLILEQLLRVAQDRSATEPNIAAFVQRVSRIAFLGTPHRGADLATWAGMLRSLIRPSPATKGLARNDPNLRELNRWFQRYASANGIAIMTLIETKKTFGFLVVPPDSADPGLPSDPIPLDANHLGIAAPASRKSEVYAHVKRFLEASTTRERVEQTLTGSAWTSNLSAPMPQSIVDAEVERRLTRLRKSRFFGSARPADQPLRLAADLSTGDLALASPITKAKGLAWCARLLLGKPGHAEGPELAKTARRLADTEEVSLAEAFEQSYAGDLEGALFKLSQIKSPAARAAAFILVKNDSNEGEALRWLRQSGLTLGDLDSDGRLFVIAAQLESSLFTDALASCAVLEPSDFERTPALWIVAANAHLASVVPHELATIILSQPPFVMGQVSLADDDASLEIRRKARDLYQQAAVAAKELDCREIGCDASDRALLLSLRDPNERDAAINDLQHTMRSPEHSLRRLPIALQFGLKIDLDTVEAEIDRQVTLSANGSPDATLARLAIIQTKPLKERAKYIQRHRRELLKHLNVAFIAGIEIQSLVASDQLPLAKDRLEELANHDVPAEQLARLSQLIAETDSDPTAVREKRFTATENLTDLVLLVEALEGEHDWARLATYAALLFQRTNDLPNCELYARALFETGRVDEVVDFLDGHAGLLARSDQLQSILAWSLYNLGDVNRCRDVLSRLREHRGSPDDRLLVVNLAVVSGDWYSLGSFVEREWDRREHRSAAELLRAGQIAQQLTSARAATLIRAAAAKASDDAHVLLGCYSTAVAAGWEDDATFKWFERAATLSDSDGPVQRLTLHDLVERQPDWQRRETEVWDQLNAGLIPMCAAARMLNRSLAEFSMLPALANLGTIDPRRRTPLYTYSGARGTSSGMPDSIAIDPTALLIAGTFELLEPIVRAVSRVVVPHSTLSWLFEERQRVQFHQPSRITHAREIRRLIDSGLLRGIEQTAPIDDNLASDVGPELACLLAEASADWGPEHRQRRVVKSGPIHRVRSLMEEEADIGAYKNYVCGCLTVVDALAQQGRLTKAEEHRARTFLTQHETPPPDGSAIPAGSVLYMDSVSLSYFQHLRLLSKFKASGLSVMISPNEIAAADRLIEYAALAERANVVIEHIRDVLSSGIANGKVRLAPIVQGDNVENGVLGHPAIDIIQVAELADAAVVDDRCFNQHSQVSHDSGASTPIYTTYDLLSALELEEDQNTDYLSRMRSAGMVFVPVDRDELSVLLSRATVVDGALVENAELKALRENLQLCRMSNGLTLPKEASWFDNLVRVLIDTIRSQWHEGNDTTTAAARSTWLLELISIRGWSHRYVGELGRGSSQVRFRTLLVGLMAFRTEAPTPLRHAYWEWLDRALLDHVRETESELFTTVIQEASHLIRNTIMSLPEAEGDGD